MKNEGFENSTLTGHIKARKVVANQPNKLVHMVSRTGIVYYKIQRTGSREEP